MFFNVTGRVLAGTDNESGTVVSLSGLPAGATGEFVDLARYCCGTYLYRMVGDNPVKISTSSSTPTGSYPVQVTYRTPEGVQRSATYTIYVDPVPSLVQKTGAYFPPDVPLASASKWSSDMLTFGRQHCTSAEAGQYTQYNVTYYDGTRVYYQIADRTGDSSWNACADMVYGSYSQYVNNNNGTVAGYQVFPQGMAMRFQRTGDAAALKTLTSMETNGLYSNWPDVPSIIDWIRSRELSYGIETNLAYQSVGGAVNPHLQDLIEVQLGHFDQWFLSKSSDYTQPFMVALAAEALIQYWDKSHDPRIPPTLQMAADQIWAKSWDVSCNCFRYYNDDGTYSLSQDLNLLIAPLYGWVFQRTGAQVYRDEGDQIFNSGVAGAWLDGGKQFSQNYRWSAKYVEWRSLAGQSPLSVAFTSPTTGAAYTTSSSPITVSGTVSGQNVTQVTWVTDHGANGAATGTSPWTASGLVLQSGSNQITVTAHDSSGNQASATITVTLSPQATDSPTIAFTSPTSATTFSTSSNSINLSGTASDSLAITQVTWTSDRGGSGPATGTNAWSVNDIALQSGSNKITVTAQDSGGHQSSKDLTVTVGSADPTPPTIHIAAPTSAPTFTTSNSAISLSGTAWDNAAVVLVTWVTSGGASGTASGTTNWTISGLALPAGSTGVTVTAHDAAGNLASAILNITYTAPDPTPPTISITSPTYGPTFTAPDTSINLGGVASDNVGVTQVTWATDRGGSGLATGTSGWSINGILVPTGTTHVTVTAHDAAGNVASSVLTVTYTAPDTTPPTVRITSPTSGPTFSSSNNSVNLGGTASDDTGVTQVTWVTDHGVSGIATGTNSWSIHGLVLESGTNHVTVTAGDAAGNAASAVLTVTYTPSDTAPPTVHIVSPTSSGTYATSSTTVALTGTASDDVGVTQVSWATDRGASGTASGANSWAIGSVPLQSGHNVITVTARDAAGNQATVGLAVTYTAPSGGIAITSPTAGSTYRASNNTVTLGGTAPAGTAQVTWSSDHGAQGEAAGTSTWTTSAIALATGTNRITVTARDALGSQSSAMITVVLSDPSIVNSTLPPGKAGRLYSYQLNAVGGIPPFTWSAGSVPTGLQVSETGTITGTPAATGTFALNVAVRDSVDAEASATVNLQIDSWLTLVSGASLTPGPVAPASMVTGFGFQLAAAAQSATTSPLPTSMGDCTVTVRDANGVERPASLYYVSPDQINFTVPADTAVGAAIATVHRGNQILATGSLYVTAVAPQLFFLNQDQLAAAGLVRVTGDAYTYEPTSRLDDTTNQFVAVPIDLSSDTDQVYLTVYGTGFRSRSSLDSVHVYVGGVLVPVSYAGPSNTFDGLDIVNVLLPPELRGKGTADISLTVNGATANIVRVLIQ